ncbi:2-phospho-L-lactate guanylyltransferase [Methanobrevibacter filiformis]|uniref:2-phospho-L-lactate guanylyltransferase n=1 Tax=Methanobrevibacter filiformis TaxID=55758 RepID=A0A162FIE4_9EURY|nr:2-phospho-L-lactate guanylyltransferase [Methanobrevibacter filiformis]KZX10450.1 2-phospho-L-lactate guanylyltransferase [Methanobrevibacter filiformis]
MDDIYAIIPVSKFSNAKTRLSPFLNLKERENLLKAMLKDVTSTLNEYVDKIIIISADKDVLDYAKTLGAISIVENDESNLNLALIQAMDWAKDKVAKVIISPSDLPLISRSGLDSLINKDCKNYDFIIVPSKGGGTNGLIIKPLAIKMEFGENSYKKHLKQACLNNLNFKIHDSFFMSLDVNITEDLGEIMLHGEGSQTQKYLKSLNIVVKPIHGAERLKVTRGD